MVSLSSHGLGRVGDPRAIDQDPLLPVRFPRLGEGRGDLLVTGHVDLAEDAADLGRDLFAARRIAIEHSDLRPAPRELPRGRLAEARRTSGHDRCYPFDLHPNVPCDSVPPYPRGDAQHKGEQAWSTWNHPSQSRHSPAKLRQFIVNAGWIGDKASYYVGLRDKGGEGERQ